MNIIIGTTIPYYSKNTYDGIGVYTTKLLKEISKTRAGRVRGFVFNSRLKPVNQGFASSHPPMMSRHGFAVNSLASMSLGLSLEENRLEGADLFHATDHLIPCFKKIPVVATVHDAVPASNPEWVTLGKLQRYMLTRSMQWPLRFICISRYSARQVMQYYRIPETRVDIVYHGIEKNFLERIPLDVLEDRLKQFGLVRQRYFLHVGMFQPRKNHVNLIRAFQLLPRALRENYSLVMVGNYGWGCSRVVKEVRRMEGEKEARWLQGVDEKDLIALYQGCAAFVFPSLFEGFGFPVLEAFASRVPVITSNASSLPEVSGDAALLIDPENSREIADAMSQVVSNNTLREQLVSRGAMRASLFTWEKAAAETLAVYRKL